MSESCDCDRTSIHDCVCPECRNRFLAALLVSAQEQIALLMDESNGYRARVAELEAENTELKRKLKPVGCWDDDPVIGPLLREAYNTDAG